MSNVLIADVCTAEFGWEIMCWQGLVRRRAQEGFDTVVVASTDGHLPLYADLNPHFVPHRIEGLRDCWEMKKISNRREAERVHIQLDSLQREYETLGCRVERIRPSGFVSTSEQVFIPFGSREAALAAGPVADVVVHARTKRGKNPLINALNWRQRDWDRYVASLRALGLTVASIGSPDASLLPEGTLDHRGHPLDTVMNLLAAARLVVGPSSGPIHLASLCRAPHLVWVPPLHGSRTLAWGTTRQRYESIWNPFGTPHRVIELDGDRTPPPEKILAQTADFLEQL